MPDKTVFNETALDEIEATVSVLQSVVDAGSAGLAGHSPDDNQALAYDLAHVAARAYAARAMLAYARYGEREARLAAAFTADSLTDLAGRAFGRERDWGIDAAGLPAAARSFCQAYGSPEFLAGLAAVDPPRHLDGDFTLVRDTFRRFADDKLAAVAERIHREDADIPEELITQLAELGAFGLSIPEKYDGFAAGGEADYLGMVIATEELSRGSLAVGGSLITRPEIFARALLAGGTEEQRAAWLPRLASAEKLSAIAVTEPDHGSDVAGIRTSARKTDGGWLISGVKTWCTFAGRADVLMVLARTDPDPARAHRGLSVFVVEKPAVPGHEFSLTQPGGGTMTGRAIATLGYRGMHSFEIGFDDWLVPDDALMGGDEGAGRGFYIQMAGFENGRLQTAARATGVMQAAYEAAKEYAANRVVFGHPVGSYQLTQVKIARMAFLIEAARQAAYAAARAVAGGSGTVESAMVKAFACRAAEWVTREAMQIHGGMGYAEEFAVSRLFVDARVLSIFEGADETLCLKVIARRLPALTGHTN
jgi:(2S)-methylsuccinyl-CoA dehydrogenase